MIFNPVPKAADGVTGTGVSAEAACPAPLPPEGDENLADAPAAEPGPQPSCETAAATERSQRRRPPQRPRRPAGSLPLPMQAAAMWHSQMNGRGDGKMAVTSPKRKRSKACPVELAVAAVVDGNPNPLDEDMSGIDPDRTSLDLPDGGHQETCSRCSRPAVENCPACGSPVCGDCDGCTGA